jgi:YidC/Oxa1 family membrane protein insertase
MDDRMDMFAILATPLGFIMRLLHMVISNYGWVIITFTILVRLLMFPLSLKQQKSTARTSAYQPMIAELQKKWANDKQRQQQEMQKFYEENNIKMTAGCAPMLVSTLVIFGIIAVIQAPLTHILQGPPQQVSYGVAIVQKYEPELEIQKDAYTQQSRLIGRIQRHPEWFQGEQTVEIDGEETVVAIEPEALKNVEDFDFNFLGLDLSEAPTLDFNRNIIMPILSILTMLGSQIIIMRTSGQQGQSGSKMMWVMTVVMGVMFGFFAFRVPLGFSLYYTASNVVMTVQQLVVRRIYDPVKIREEVEREIEARRKAKKGKKKVTIQETDGVAITAEMSEAEIVKLRLARARELDARKYGDGGETEVDTAAAAKARAVDEEKYGANRGLPAPGGEGIADGAPETDAGRDGENAGEKAEEKGQKTEDKTDYKPGRRKRARQNRDKAEDASFVEAEQAAEERAERKEEYSGEEENSDA